MVVCTGECVEYLAMVRVVSVPDSRGEGEGGGGGGGGGRGSLVVLHT